jgi:hypothetical protein
MRNWHDVLCETKLNHQKIAEYFSMTQEEISEAWVPILGVNDGESN